MLARRRRPLHHAAAGLHEGSGNRRAQHRHLPHAGLRRPHDRHALAAAQGRRAALSRRRAAGQAAAGGGGAGCRTRRCRIAATAPMPEGLDELLLAGFLRRERVELVKCVTVDLEVPANAQIVLEGYVEPGERRREGPFGDHTGFYSHPDDYPVFHLTCITQRKTPDLPDDRRRHSADGGLLPRQGQRADLPAADSQDGSGDRRHALSRRRASSTTS